MVKIYNISGKAIFEESTKIRDYTVELLTYKIVSGTVKFFHGPNSILVESFLRDDIEDGEGNTFATDKELSDYLAFFLAENDLYSTILEYILDELELKANEATLSSIKTSLEVMDDWDESGRAKVNIIDGQIGVSASNGLVDAGTIRIVEAASITSKILSGSRTNAGTIITIPANKIWKGSVQVAGSILSGINAAAVSGHVRLDFTPGTGGTAAYRLAQVVLHTPAGTLATTGTTSNDAVCVMDIEVYAGTTAATIDLAHTNATQLFGSCSGKIIN